MNEKNYLALLHKIWLNQKKLHIIFEDNENYKDFYENLDSSTLYTFGFTPKQIDFILENKNKYSIAKIKQNLENRSVEIITIKDPKYPDLLKQIANPPYLFYLRWEIDNSPKFSVVGSRKISFYWEKAIEKIVWEISNYFTIVSWWAAWCDTHAHLTALNNQNKTISVIWTWIDVDYPVKNKKLYDDIVLDWWAVVSIFPIWEVWNPYNFPVRNEIVAGLSVWVLVVEAAKKSWTIITSNLALDMWKDLFAIPWDIFKTSSEWCNDLIKNWNAKITTQSNDILEEYNILNKQNTKQRKIIFNDKLEEEIYNTLITDSLNINELILKTWLDITTLNFKLSMMEINNLIKNTSWWKYEIF